MVNFPRKMSNRPHAKNSTGRNTSSIWMIFGFLDRKSHVLYGKTMEISCLDEKIFFRAIDQIPLHILQRISNHLYKERDIATIYLNLWWTITAPERTATMKTKRFPFSLISLTENYWNGSQSDIATIYLNWCLTITAPEGTAMMRQNLTRIPTPTGPFSNDEHNLSWL